MNYDITIEDLVNALCEEQGIVLWKDVPGYEGVYQVSNVGGLVRSVDRYVRSKGGSLRRCKGQPMKVHLDKDGYRTISINNSSVHVARLVLMAFNPNPLKLPQVNHLDEDKLNDNAANLEWCDCKHNINWGTRNDRNGATHRELNINGKPVNQYTLDGELIATYQNQSVASQQTGIFIASISKCCLGKQHTAGGFIWKRCY